MQEAILRDKFNKTLKLMIICKAVSIDNIDMELVQN
jgi:hypothetical protein